MADSDIAISVLIGRIGTGVIHWKWTVTDPDRGGLPYLEYDATEIWTSTTNNRNTAAKAGENMSPNFIQNRPDDVPVFGWARGRNRSGYFGEWHPFGVTNGFEALSPGVEPSE